MGPDPALGAIAYDPVTSWLNWSYYCADKDVAKMKAAPVDLSRPQGQMKYFVGHRMYLAFARTPAEGNCYGFGWGTTSSPPSGAPNGIVSVDAANPVTSHLCLTPNTAQILLDAKRRLFRHMIPFPHAAAKKTVTGTPKITVFAPASP